jgi:hypothetical protein
VQAEYWSKARAQDRAFGLAQLAPGSGPSRANSTIGPIERQLNSVAPVCIAVVGGFGEGSEDLHGLIGGIARRAALTAHVRLGLEQHVAAGLIQQRSSSASWALRSCGATLSSSSPACSLSRRTPRSAALLARRWGR